MPNQNSDRFTINSKKFTKKVIDELSKGLTESDRKAIEEIKASNEPIANVIFANELQLINKGNIKQHSQETEIANHDKYIEPLQREISQDVLSLEQTISNVKEINIQEKETKYQQKMQDSPSHESRMQALKRLLEHAPIQTHDLTPSQQKENDKKNIELYHKLKEYKTQNKDFLQARTTPHLHEILVMKKEELDKTKESLKTKGKFDVKYLMGDAGVADRYGNKQQSFDCMVLTDNNIPITMPTKLQNVVARDSEQSLTEAYQTGAMNKNSQDMSASVLETISNDLDTYAMPEAIYIQHENGMIEPYAIIECSINEHGEKLMATATLDGSAHEYKISDKGEAEQVVWQELIHTKTIKRGDLGDEEIDDGEMIHEFGSSYE